MRIIFSRSQRPSQEPASDPDRFGTALPNVVILPFAARLAFKPFDNRFQPFRHLPLNFHRSAPFTKPVPGRQCVGRPFKEYHVLFQRLSCRADRATKDPRRPDCHKQYPVIFRILPGKRQVFLFKFNRHRWHQSHLKPDQHQKPPNTKNATATSPNHPPKNEHRIRVVEIPYPGLNLVQRRMHEFRIVTQLGH